MQLGVNLTKCWAKSLPGYYCPRLKWRIQAKLLLVSVKGQLE